MTRFITGEPPRPRPGIGSLRHVANIISPEWYGVFFWQPSADDEAVGKWIFVSALISMAGQPSIVELPEAMKGKRLTIGAICRGHVMAKSTKWRRPYGFHAATDDGAWIGEAFFSYPCTWLVAEKVKGGRHGKA